MAVVYKGELADRVGMETAENQSCKIFNFKFQWVLYVDEYWICAVLESKCSCFQVTWCFVFQDYYSVFYSSRL